MKSKLLHAKSHLKHSKEKIPIPRKQKFDYRPNILFNCSDRRCISRISRQFFHLPEDEKLKYIKPEGGRHGYVQMGSER